jgi:hypothetical protein
MKRALAARRLSAAPDGSANRGWLGLGADAPLALCRDMRNPLSLLAGLLGVVCLALAVFYWVTPAGGLPAFLPGFEAGSAHVHLRHAQGLLVAAVVLFAFAWFQSARKQ